MGNRLGKREKKKEPPRDNKMIAGRNGRLRIAYHGQSGGSFDLPGVQNLWEELLRRHRLSSKKTPVNWLGFGLWQEEAIKRSSTAKQATLVGKVLKVQGHLEGAERQAKDAVASVPAPSQITGHGSSSVPMSAASRARVL